MCIPRRSIITAYKLLLYGVQGHTVKHGNSSHFRVQKAYLFCSVRVHLILGCASLCPFGVPKRNIFLVQLQDTFAIEERN